MVINPRFSGCPAHNLVTIVTELARLHFHQCIILYDLKEFSDIINVIIHLSICILQV
jgi:hypothetical protein